MLKVALLRLCFWGVCHETRAPAADFAGKTFCRSKAVEAGRLLQPTQGHGTWMSLAGGPVLVLPLLSLRVLCAIGFLFGFDKVTCTAVSGCSEFSLWTLQSLMDRLQPRSSSPAVPGAVQVLVPLCQTEAFCLTAGKELKELYPHRVLKGFFEGASYCIYICRPMLYKQRLWAVDGWSLSSPLFLLSP